VGEFVPGYEASTWYGVGAPKNTPDEIVQKLNKEINAALADSKLKARLADLGAEPMSMTPAEFAKFVVDETEKWAKVIRAANSQRASGLVGGIAERTQCISQNAAVWSASRT
jgi:tripartite-type tricarboxylate transporter receptor subunit TctC